MFISNQVNSKKVHARKLRHLEWRDAIGFPVLPVSFWPKTGGQQLQHLRESIDRRIYVGLCIPFCLYKVLNTSSNTSKYWSRIQNELSANNFIFNLLKKNTDKQTQGTFERKGKERRWFRVFCSD